MTKKRPAKRKNSEDDEQSLENLDELIKLLESENKVLKKVVNGLASEQEKSGDDNKNEH